MKQRDGRLPEICPSTRTAGNPISLSLSRKNGRRHCADIKTKTAYWKEPECSELCLFAFTESSQRRSQPDAHRQSAFVKPSKTGRAPYAPDLSARQTDMRFYKIFESASQNETAGTASSTRQISPSTALRHRRRKFIDCNQPACYYHTIKNQKRQQLYLNSLKK